MSEALEIVELGEKCTKGTGQGVAEFFVNIIKSKKGEERVKVARFMHKYLNGEFRDESSEFQKAFVSFMDAKADHHASSALYDCINSPDPEDRKAGTILIVLLTETMVSMDGNRVVRFANFLLKVLLTMDEQGMEMAARGLAFLIQTSKVYAAELVEKCLDQSLEWTEEENKHNQRCLAAAIILRELALFTSTAFFLRANQFFKNIFRVMRDQKVHIRLAAANALHAALTVTSQREAKQKTEWYKKCYDEAWKCVSQTGEGLGREERYHCMLLIFNELLRIADASTERDRLIALGKNVSPDSATFNSALDFITVERFQNTVESRTARNLVTEHFEEIFEKVMEARSCRQPYNVQTLLELFLCVETVLPLLPRNPHAQLGVGLFILHNSHHLRRFLPNFFHVITEAITTKKKSFNLGDSNLFILLTFIVRAFGEEVKAQVKELVPPLLATGLSKGLVDVLHAVCSHIESIRTDVLDGLLNLLAVLLTGKDLPSKIAAPTRPVIPTGPIPITNVDRCVLALHTLGEFEFQRHSLQMFMHYTADCYMTADSVEVRLAAIRSCVCMLRPFIRVYEGVKRDQKQQVLSLIQHMLKALVGRAVTDPEVVVRMRVVAELSAADRSMLSHLAGPDILELLLMCLRDENLEMQESTVCLLGKIGMINPALVLPRLRRCLLETIGQLTNTGEGRLEQHSARLIAQMASQNPKFMRPYMGALLQALIPKLRYEQRFADVTVSVLQSLSELTIVGGSEVVKSIDILFPKLIQFATDSSSFKRREGALKTIGNLCASTAYVVDPYKDYPKLLETLLNQMRTEMSQSMRRQTMRVLGILGALDPYTHKVFTGVVFSATTAVSTALSLPINRKVGDPRQIARAGVADIVQWFNYEKCTLEEFYPSITIANLMSMLESDSFSNYFSEITQDLLTIFRSLGTQFPQFVNQVIPQLLEVTQYCRKEQKEFFLRQSGALLAIIEQHAKPYLDTIFQIIAAAWRDDRNLHMTIIGVLETIGCSLGASFAPHIPEVMPYLLEAIRTDRSPDRKLTSKALSCICVLSGSLSCHLHLVLPALLSIVDDNNIVLAARLAALEAVQELAEGEDLYDYMPRLVTSWSKAVQLPQLQKVAMALLSNMLKRRWKHFAFFKRTIEQSLEKAQIHSEDFIMYCKHSGPANEKTTGPSHEEVRKPPQMIQTPSTASRQTQQTFNVPSLQKVNVDVVSRACQVSSLVSKEDWSQWLVKLRLAVIRSGSSAAIRAVASLADQHVQLAKDLFTPAFMSVWTELTEKQQNDMTDNLLKALETSQHPDVIQTILNLAEFMDHSEKGPLPIKYAVLGKSAEGVKAYAKALRYKELQIREKGGFLDLDDAQALITFANKLNVQETAQGIMRVIESGPHKDSISKLTRSRWHEKLGEWEKAMDILQDMRKQSAQSTNEEQINKVEEHEMRCLEGLGRWVELNERVKEVKDGLDEKMRVIAARGAWAVGEWTSMERYAMDVNENTQDGSFLRAVLAVKMDKFEEANKYIEKCRDIHDAELCAMGSESYERAYGAMVLLQQLSELEEAMEFKIRPERRPRIALLWSRRLQGCIQNVDQWQKLLLLRSLVLSPSEMHPLRVKFSSLCRKQEKHSQCRSELRSLLSLPLHAELSSASAPFDRPQLVLALCKQLWRDGHEGAAKTTLEGLSRHLDRLPPSSHMPEAKRLVAKTFLKLGEWTDERAREDFVTRPPNFFLNPVMPMQLGTPFVPGLELAGGQMSPHSHHSLLDPATTNKVIQYYIKATNYDTNWHKAWHKLAVAYFSALNDEKERRTGTRLPSANTHNITFLGSPLSPLPPYNPPSIHGGPNYAVECVKAFTRALQLAQGSRLEDTLRLLAVWFEHGEVEEVYLELRDSLKTLPVEMWLEVVPQLIARLDSRSHPANLIQQVVLDVAKQFPQSLVYALTVAKKSPNEVRARHACEMLSMLMDTNKKLIEQAQTVSDELVRCAILWHEQWHEALDDASRFYFQEKNIKSMLEVLDPLHKMIEAGPTTMKENSFNQTYYMELQDARKFSLAFQRTGNGKELTQAWEIYYQVFKRIATQLRSMSSLDLNYISPILQKSRHLELAVPGTFDPNAPLVTISSFGSHLQVITSKQRPRKLTIRGSDGMEYAFLLKGHEDPRQDERVMQLFGLVNTLLVQNSETCRRNLTIQRYSIVALSQNSGLIGWIPDCDTLHSLVRDYRDKKKIQLSLEHKEMQRMVSEVDQLTILQKVQLFEKALSKTSGDDLQQILWLKSPNSQVWFERRTNYTRSMACMSMVGYILGLGDRHPSNLMLDRTTGKIVHIDFGDCFEVAMTREKFPEKIPFRLTRMLIKAMEITGMEGNYRVTCERVMRMLRQHKESLLAVLEAFLYDPLINWRLLDVNKRNPGDKKDYTKVNMTDAAPEAVSRDAIERIKAKLAGREPEFGGGATKVEEHVQRLIVQATMHDNLSQCYIGWCPFW